MHSSVNQITKSNDMKSSERSINQVSGFHVNTMAERCRSVFMKALVGLMVCGFVSFAHAQTPSPIPHYYGAGQVQYGAPQIYEDISAACSDIASRHTNLEGLYPPPHSFLGYSIKTRLNTEFVEGVLPYNVPGVLGWDCIARYKLNFPWGSSEEPYTYGSVLPMCAPIDLVGSYPLGSGLDACPDNPSFYADTDDGGGEDDKKVGDPINASSGNMYRSEVDVRGELSFVRTYNSLQGWSTLGTRWTHNYNQSVQILMAPAPPKFGLVAGGGGGGSSSSGQSTKQQTAELACTAGFAELQPRVANWAGATATYANDTCSISKSGQFLAAMNLFFSWSKSPPDRPFPIGYQLYRDDGTTIRLTGGVLAPALPPGTGLRFLKTPTGFAVFDQNDTVEIYDSAGRLTSIVSRTGYTQTVAYGATTGRISTVTDSFGKTLTFTYDEQYRLIGVTDAGADTTSYGYDAQNRLNLVTFPDLTTHSYRYESTEYPNGLTGFVDANNVLVTSWTYDAKGRATSTSSAGGANPTTMVYNANGSVTHTDALGAVRTYTFDKVGSRNLITGTTGAPCPTCGEGKSMTYDSFGWPASRTDNNNRVTQYVYDPVRGLETSRTEAFGTPRARTITTTWHPNFRLPTQINEPGRRTTFTHDPQGNILTATTLDTATSESRTWSYTHNSFGRVLTIDGPRSDVLDVTTYTYYNCTTGYQCGQVATVTNAVGHVSTVLTYNAHGLPLTYTDVNGVLTTLGYDFRQRLTSREASGELTTIEYWPIGKVKKVTMPDGSYLAFSYDNAHRLSELTDSEGNRISYVLDSASNRTKEDVFDPSNALTQTRSHVFNQLSQLYQVVGAANTASATTTLGYDGNGNQTAVTAPLGRNASSQYDELNRLVSATDPMSGVTTIGYDGLDQIISVTDPRSLQTAYTFNALGDLKQLVSPDTGTTTNTFDVAGNLKTSTNARSITAAYTYDASNRLTQVSDPDQTVGFIYDSGANATGRLSSVSDASGSTGWTYTSKGQIDSKVQSIGSVSKSVTYGYNTAGQLTSTVTPSGKDIAYTYTDGKITAVHVNGIPIATNVQYEPFGPTNGWTWGNGSLAVRVFDTDGNVTHIDSAGLNTYSYDDAFRITGVADAANSSNSLAFGYDLRDRLTSSNKAGQSQTFSYDASDNRATQGGTETSTFANSSSSNRLNNVSGAITRSYTHDDAGNTLSDGTTSYSFTSTGRMKTSTKGGVTTTYTYNAQGERVKKANASGTTYFVYDEAGRLLGRYDQTGSLIEEIVWLNNTPIATIRSGSCGMAIFYIHTDHLNVPRKITKRSTPDIVWRWDSDAFGSTPANENPSGIGTFSFNLRFPGQYFDSETGNHYNYFRDYDPRTGRYIESDPIGLNGGLNTYAYVIGNPISYIDPYGLYDLYEFMDDATNYAAGFGDTVSFGLTDYIRDKMGTNGEVDKCSDAYEYGSDSGEVNQALLGAGLTAKALARLSRLQDLRLLNQNRYMRFGLGKPGPGMQKVDMMRIGPSPWNIATPTRAWWTHWRL